MVNDNAHGDRKEAASARSRPRNRVGSRTHRVWKEGSACPNCGRTCEPGADLCRACGRWLQPGRCVFCYARVSSDQRRCSECGNLPGGIECSCGQHSFFDFCPACSRPVTRRATRTLEDLHEQLGRRSGAARDRPPQSGHGETGEGQLKEVIGLPERTDEQAAPRPPPGIEEVLDRFDGVSFDDHQKARCFHEAVRDWVEEVHDQEPVGWLCNAFGTHHDQGPWQCACPDAGGRWIYS